MRSPACAAAAALLAAAFLTSPAAQTRITTPQEQLGFSFGDDYQLANYTQIADYWRKLDAQSDRMVLQDIGKTAEGRPQLMAIVTSPANHKNLAKYRDISRRLAFAEGVTGGRGAPLSREGKAVVWIDGGLHATETLGAQQLAEMVYQMVSRTDAETMRFLDECIILFVHANPGRQRSRRRLVHAESGSAEAQRRGPAAALSEVHRPRQQPRLLRVDAGRNREHQPRPLPRLAAADSLQPSPERAGRERSSGPRRSATPTTTTWTRC